jgi:hypothetical protein
LLEDRFAGRKFGGFTAVLQLIHPFPLDRPAPWSTSGLCFRSS